MYKIFNIILVKCNIMTKYVVKASITAFPRYSSGNT